MKKGQAYLVRLGDTERMITVRRLSETAAGGTRYGVCLDDGEEVEVDAVRPVSDVLSLVHQGRSWEAGLVEVDDGWECPETGERYALVDGRMTSA